MLDLRLIRSGTLGRILLGLLLITGCQSELNAAVEFRDQTAEMCVSAALYEGYYEQTLGAVGLEAGVNMLQEVQDFVEGSDAPTDELDGLLTEFVSDVDLLSLSGVSSFVSSCQRLLDAANAHVESLQ